MKNSSSPASLHVFVGGQPGRLWLPLLGLCSALLLGACSGTPPSIDEVAAAAERKASLNDDKGVIADLHEHIAKHGDSSGRLTWLLAKANARSGNFNGALAALESSLKSRYITSEQAMTDVAFAALRTDIRFVTLVAGTAVDTGMAAPQPISGRTASSSQTRMPARQSAQTNDAVARLDGGAVEARAGSVSVRLPD